MNLSTGWTGVQVQFKGMRNDVGSKFIGPEYLLNAVNVNYDSIVGADKILMPEMEADFNTAHDVDGIFEFAYLNAQNVPQSVSIAVVNGTLYKDWINATPTAIYTGMTPGKCDFGVLNDQLFIVNGLDYPIRFDGTLVAQMGAPYAADSGSSGNLNGAYYYAMTYVTAGGEEVIGTVSNSITVVNSQMELTLPIGYAGTTGRKIYRTIAGGTSLFLLAIVGDNTTLTYVDNVADGSLGAAIPAINNECPRVKFIEVSFERLIGLGDPLYPTQAWVTDSEIEVFDNGNFENVSNIDNDGTPLTGLSLDYAKVVIGSKKAVYVMDVSTATPTLSSTRSNVGVLNGYSMVKVPVQGDFPGGVMFLSTLNDIRLFNGNFAQPVSTSLDNLQADNLSQPIRPIMDYYVTPQTNVSAIFYDYKYHIILGTIILIYDIRVKGWAIYQIATDSYSPNWNCFAVINNFLYSGQAADGIIDQFYVSIQYRDEEVSSIVQGGQLLASNEVRYMQDFFAFFVMGGDDSVDISLVIDGEEQHKLTYTVPLKGGFFDSQYFTYQDYEVGQNTEDYRVVHVNLWGRWIQYTIRQTKGRTFFRGFKILWQTVKNKE
jgi:hypothetical protein